MTGRYAIFARRGRDGNRRMHAAEPGAAATICGLPIGVGTGLVRDGDYRRSVPCRQCWDTQAAAPSGNLTPA
jgi:hypothetical protein